MLLALKLALTPLLIIATALAGRRWGAEVSGWLIGLPLTSGPVSLLLYVQYGSEFAARASVGNLSGYSAIAVYCLVYRLAARRANGFISLALSTGVYALIALTLNHLALGLLPAFAVVVMALTFILRWMPTGPNRLPSVAPPRWDIPMRVSVATVLVLALTASANTLGPQLSGLLSTYPIFATVLVVFTHRQHGPAAAIQAMRGVVLGEFSAATFFLVIGLSVPRLQLLSYPLAILAALVVNGLSLRWVSRPPYFAQPG